MCTPEQSGTYHRLCTPDRYWARNLSRPGKRNTIDFSFKGTVMQIEKAIINDGLCI